MISIPAIPLVWWRVLITCLSLIFIINVFSLLKQTDKKLLFKMFGIGSLVGIHWMAFYGAIKASNASITLVCMATTTFFTAFIEPLVFKTPIRLFNLAYGLLVVPGMILIVQNIESYQFMGVWLGLLAAFLAAVFATLNKTIVDKIDPKAITFFELLSAFVFISFCLPFISESWYSPFVPVKMDWFYMLILSIGCTTIAYVLSLLALKKLSAFEANLVVNLEPVYGILLAIIILKEHQELSPKFYAGVFMIMVAVFSYPLVKKKWNIK